MNEGNQTIICSDTRSFINQPRAPFFQLSERRANITDAHGDVMNPRPALFKKLCDGRISARRLKQLNARLAHRQHRHAHALLLDNLRMRHLKPQRIAPEPKRIIQRASSNAYVLNLHNQWPVVSGQWSVPATSFTLLTDHRLLTTDH